jgi:hypothetical protein
VVLIDRPLSGYRHHGRNFHKTTASFYGLRFASPDAVQRSGRSRHAVLARLLREPERFGWLIGEDRYWRALDRQCGTDQQGLHEFYAEPQMQDLFAEHYPALCSAFGGARVERELRQRLPEAFFARLAA